MNRMTWPRVVALTAGFACGVFAVVLTLAGLYAWSLLIVAAGVFVCSGYWLITLAQTDAMFCEECGWCLRSVPTNDAKRYHGTAFCSFRCVANYRDENEQDAA